MNKISPLVSIIVPSYNHRYFVEKCLDSIILDSYSNKELIIIDDGSTDGSVEKIKKWIDDNGKLIKISFVEKKNSGVSNSLNLGLAIASGDYIVPIASDDELLNEGIATRVNFLEKNSQIDAVFGDCIVIDDRGQVVSNSGIFEFHLADKQNYENPNSLAREIIWMWSIPGPVLMYRRKYLIELGGYNEKIKVEDWDLYLRMVASEKLAFIDSKVSRYRVHNNNVSKKDPARVRRVHYDLLKTAYCHLGLFKGYLRYLMVKKIIIMIYQVILSYFGKKI